MQDKRTTASEMTSEGAVVRPREAESQASLQVDNAHNILPPVHDGGQHRQVLILIALQSHTVEEDQELQRQDQLEWHRIRQQQQKLDTQSSGADPATCDFMGPSRRALLVIRAQCLRIQQYHRQQTGNDIAP